LLIRSFLPSVAVLSWQMPSKTVLPPSSRVVGAFEHTFQLTERGMCVLVTLHAKARSRKHLLATRKWHVTELRKPRSGRVEYVLEPASNDTCVTILRMRLCGEEQGRGLYLSFEEPRTVQGRGIAKAATHLVFRRQRRALTDAQRIFASP
jgi:hypothetical protein